MGDGENGVKLPTHDTLCTEWRFGSGLKVWNAILQVIQNWKGYCCKYLIILVRMERADSEMGDGESEMEL